MESTKQPNPKKPLRPGTLVTRRGAAEILGCSRQRVGAIQDRLPRPLDLPDGKPIWRRADVERFARDRNGT